MPRGWVVAPSLPFARMRALHKSEGAGNFRPGRPTRDDSKVKPVRPTGAANAVRGAAAPT